MPRRRVSYPGHSVLQIPVPALEPFVRARTAHYDAAYLSADPTFVHAHITVLGPFLPEPEPADLAMVESVLSGFEPVTFDLRRIDTFPSGIIHLVPEPDRPFRALTRRLAEAFPRCPPYGGAYGDVVPHLTLDQRSDEVSEASTRRLLGTAIPVTCRADRVDLAWYEPYRCRVLASWRLGPVGSPAGAAPGVEPSPRGSALVREQAHRERGEDRDEPGADTEPENSSPPSGSRPGWWSVR